MTREEAIKQMMKARELLDQAEGLVAEVECACDDADGVSLQSSVDVFGIVRDHFNEVEYSVNEVLY